MAEDLGVMDAWKREMENTAQMTVWWLGVREEVIEVRSGCRMVNMSREVKDDRGRGSNGRTGKAKGGR